MKKKPFVTKEQLDEIIKKYPTPFHLYDEKGIRKNMQALKKKHLHGIRGIKSILQLKQHRSVPD